MGPCTAGIREDRFQAGHVVAQNCLKLVRLMKPPRISGRGERWILYCYARYGIAFRLIRRSEFPVHLGRLKDTDAGHRVRGTWSSLAGAEGFVLKTDARKSKTAKSTAVSIPTCAGSPQRRIRPASDSQQRHPAQSQAPHRACDEVRAMLIASPEREREAVGGGNSSHATVPGH